MNRNRRRQGGRARSYGNRPTGQVDVSKYISKGDAEYKTPEYINAHGFEDFDLNLQLLKNIRSKGYTEPTEIQDRAIPEILTGKDVVGIAGTGTGKTASFLIPLVQDLIEDTVDKKVLIITPTRELATQIYQEFRWLTKGFKLFATCLIGGNPVHQSIKDLKRLSHIVIGTPGRILDMNKRGVLKFDRFETLVLDEFDRMLDMGFVDDVMSIEAQMRNKTQTLLFSATMDKSIQFVLQDITRDPVKISAKKGIRPSDSIKQEVRQAPSGKRKIDFVHDIISEHQKQKVLLFCGTKRKVDQVHKTLQSGKIRSDVMHGDKSQRAREVALRKFKSGKIDVLIATDVMARGIDVNDISVVINYEVPQNYDDYIHRIGRTGRAGKSGKAITLID